MMYLYDHHRIDVPCMTIIGLWTYRVINMIMYDYTFFHPAYHILYSYLRHYLFVLTIFVQYSIA